MFGDNRRAVRIHKMRSANGCPGVRVGQLFYTWNRAVLVMSGKIQSKCKYTKTSDSEQRKREAMMSGCCAWQRSHASTVPRRMAGGREGAFRVQQHSTPYITAFWGDVGCCFAAQASVVRSWRLPGITASGVSRRSQVRRAHVRVVRLRRIPREVPAIQPLEVRPS
jgi:hypothetical protein